MRYATRNSGTDPNRKIGFAAEKCESTCLAPVTRTYGGSPSTSASSACDRGVGGSIAPGHCWCRVPRGAAPAGCRFSAGQPAQILALGGRKVSGSQIARVIDRLRNNGNEILTRRVPLGPDETVAKKVMLGCMARQPDPDQARGQSGEAKSAPRGSQACGRESAGALFRCAWLDSGRGGRALPRRGRDLSLR